MASFSFGAGNAAKLLRIPLYAAGRIGSVLVPRGSRWVFGCGAGVGDGALALWRIAVSEGHDALWLTSSAKEDAEASALGIRTARKSTFHGWWATARAGVVVVTHGLGDVNRYAVSGAFLVQLWHGIPLKRIGLDSPATMQVPNVPGAAVLRRLLRVFYRRAAQQIQILPAASDRSRGRLESAFGLTGDRVLVTGEPRVDVLSTGTAAERKTRAAGVLARAVGALPAHSRIVLYAPTWRDGAADPAVPTAEEWVQIIRVLHDLNAVLLIRSHPLGEGGYVPPIPSQRIRALGSALLTDVSPALPAIDVLITDYSSLAFDVGLLATPTLYLAPDASDYARERGFYGRFEDVAGADAARDWPTALAQLEHLFTEESAFTAAATKSAALSVRMHAYRDGANTARVYQAIRTRGIPAPKGTP